MTRRALIPVNKPLGPRAPASLIRREATVSPGRAFVLLILERRVSAGWEMMAAAKPAMRPAPRFKDPRVPAESSVFGLPVALISFSYGKVFNGMILVGKNINLRKQLHTPRTWPWYKALV